VGTLSVFLTKSNRLIAKKVSFLQDGLLNTVLAAQDAQQLLRLFDNVDRESVLDVIDSAWLALDQETGGGGAGRWSLQYLQMILIIEKYA
jgi:hypothetical protein